MCDDPSSSATDPRRWWLRDACSRLTTRESAVSSLSAAGSRRLIRKLETIDDLSSDERSAVEGLAMTERRIRADHDLVREGDRPSQCCLIVEGFACRYRILDDGKRQIFSFHMPGDIVDIQGMHLPVLDHDVGTLVTCDVAFIPHQSLNHLIAEHPRIGRLFWRDTLIDAAVFRAWMVGMGRRPAKAQMAHLFCELFVRFELVGETKANTFQLSATQGELGDALGLSTVHVNRVVQELRAAGVITLARGTLTIDDWDGLAEIGRFDPNYLHLHRRGAA